MRQQINQGFGKLKDGYVTLYNITTKRDRGSKQEEIQTKLRTLRYESLYIRDRDYRYFNDTEKTVQQLKIKTFYTVDENIYNECTNMYIHTKYHNKMYRVVHKDYDIKGGYIYWYLQESVSISPIDTNPIEVSKYDYPPLNINSESNNSDLSKFKNLLNTEKREEIKDFKAKYEKLKGNNNNGDNNE